MSLDRIAKNEIRLDNISLIIDKLEDALKLFRDYKRDFTLLNKYYGSKAWLKDKDDYENNKLSKIKAGVLSEDAVWNLNERLDDLVKDMQLVIDNYSKK